MHDPNQHTPEPLSAETQAMWNVASTIVSGMLANPARSHFSVKDGVSLFDEVLSELVSFARVRGEMVQYLDSVDRRLAQPMPGTRVHTADQQTAYAAANHAAQSDFPPTAVSSPGPITPIRRPKSHSTQPRQPAPYGIDLTSVPLPPAPPTPYAPDEATG